MGLSSIIEKWDHIAFLLYNVLARIMYCLNYIAISKNVRRNRKFKNKHKNEECFMFLNGPSTLNEDISLLKNKTVFCVNYFYKGDKINEIMPDYYCITDDMFFLKEKQYDLRELMLKCSYSTFFFNYKYLRYNSLAENVYVTYGKYMPNAVNIKSDYDGLCSGFTNVALYAINLAIFMGFKKIYLLGLDFYLDPKLSWSHSYPDSKSELDDKTKFSVVLDKNTVCGMYWYYSLAQYQFYYMKDYAKRMGVSIYNLNPNSAVRAFPYLKYNDIFNKR